MILQEPKSAVFSNIEIILTILACYYDYYY